MMAYYRNLEHFRLCYCCRGDLDDGGECPKCASMSDAELEEDIRLYRDSVNEEIPHIAEDKSIIDAGAEDSRKTTEAKYSLRVHLNRINLWSRCRAHLICIRDARK